MEDYKVYRLKLYSSPEYSYHVVLESRSFILRFKYNTRMQKWVMSIGYSNSEPIVNSKVLYPNFPIFANKIPELKGYFIMVSIGNNINETISNPYEIHKYYNLYYVDDDSLSDPDY